MNGLNIQNNTKAGEIHW